MNRPSGVFKQTERSCESKMEGSHPDKLRLVPDGCVELLLRDVG